MKWSEMEKSLSNVNYLMISLNKDFSTSLEMTSVCLFLYDFLRYHISVLHKKSNHVNS